MNRPVGARAGLLTSLALLAGCGHVSSPSPGGQPHATPSRLDGTRWRLVDFQSMDDAQERKAPADPDRYTIAFGTDGQASLQIDCNRGSGAWRATPSGGGGTLTFGPIATTRMACPEPSMGPLLDRQLPYVRSYTVSQGRLHMSLMADGGIFTWEPAPGAVPPRGRAR